MKNENKLLSVGSIVYLKGGAVKTVILARGQLIKTDKKDKLPTYFDYMGCMYPEGFDPDKNYYFNHNNIDKVIFSGYEDEEEERYLETLDDWKNDNRGQYFEVDKN